MEELVAKGQLGKAALLARSLGKHAYAAMLFTQARRPYEAAVCSYEAGNARASLDSFLEVAPGSALYRQACTHVARLATELQMMSPEIEHFVDSFLGTDPRSPEEIAAFRRLGILFQRHELFDQARTVLAKVVQSNPGDVDASQRLRTLEAVARNAPSVYRSIVREHSEAATARGQKRNPRQGAGNVASGDETMLADAHAEAPRPSTTDAPVVIGGRYRVIKEIGRGGMGVVFRASDIELGEEVAIKLFLKEQSGLDLERRFKRELLLCRRLTHPNIIRLYDIGAHEGRKFISMELLDGESLEQLVGRPIGVRRALDYVMQICAGLGAAHELGIVHRDVKPGNVFLTRAGLIKLMDFGLAKRRAGGQSITQAGFAAGTPGYIAPEQVTQFGAATHAADLYALGVVAYEILTGRRPFPSDNPMKILELQLTTVPVPPSKYVPLPEGLEEIVVRLMDRDPAVRYGSAREVYEKLAAIRSATKDWTSRPIG